MYILEPTSFCQGNLFWMCEDRRLSQHQIKLEMNITLHNISFVFITGEVVDAGTDPFSFDPAVATQTSIKGEK